MPDEVKQMDEERALAIREIKIRVNNMLAERHAITGEANIHMSTPSEYWQRGCRYFEYMLDLPEKYFTTLREHSHHLTGDRYTLYMAPNEQNQRKYQKAFNHLWSQIPEQYWINEPEEGYGFQYKERWINNDTLRYQEVINRLYQEGILQAVSKSEDPLNILEIGGGFGGFIYHLSRCLPPKNCKYFIIDLPEVLLFSASYLAMHQSPDEVYIYDSKTTLEDQKVEFTKHRFNLIPSYQLELLENIVFKLVVNMASFQEMRSQQVNEYLDFIERHLDGILFSRNRDINLRQNPEGLHIGEALEERFLVEEVPIIGKSALTKKNRVRKSLLNFGRKLLIDSNRSRLPKGTPYKDYICQPRNKVTV